MFFLEIFIALDLAAGKTPLQDRQRLRPAGPAAPAPGMAEIVVVPAPEDQPEDEDQNQQRKQAVKGRPEPKRPEKPVKHTALPEPRPPQYGVGSGLCETLAVKNEPARRLSERRRTCCKGPVKRGWSAFPNP